MGGRALDRNEQKKSDGAEGQQGTTNRDQALIGKRVPKRQQSMEEWGRRRKNEAAWRETDQSLWIQAMGEKKRGQR